MMSSFASSSSTTTTSCDPNPHRKNAFVRNPLLLLVVVAAASFLLMGAMVMVKDDTRRVRPMIMITMMFGDRYREREAPAVRTVTTVTSADRRGRRLVDRSIRTSNFPDDVDEADAPAATTSEQGSGHRNSNDSSNTSLPSLVWLLSFPNSGTSYTIINTQRISNTSSGTNYANEIPKGSDIVRIRPDVVDSPFLLRPALARGQSSTTSESRREPPPQPLILTKTHCTGYCTHCPTLLVSALEFRRGCANIHSYSNIDNKTHNDGQYYNANELVQKAVHLFRDPLDNLVSRKHLHIKSSKQKRGEFLDPNNHHEQVMMQDTPEGMRAWCQYTDDAVLLAHSSSSVPQLSNAMRAYMKTIPCSVELYRYVQWHNLAIQTTQHLGLDVLYLYYEDYATHYRATVSSLLDYLELNMTHRGFDLALPFTGGVNKSYHHLYSPQRSFSRTAMHLYVRRISSPTTWTHLRRYFVDVDVNVDVDEKDKVEYEYWYEEEQRDQSAESNNKRKKRRRY